MLPLPMTPAQCLGGVIVPAHRELLPCKLSSLESDTLLLAIALQESGLRHRRQVGGPAMGLWQFEQRGGVHGVIRHEATRLMARAVCLLRAVAPTDGDVYGALAHDDLLACAFARLLLWTDPNPLPRLGGERVAWDYYLRNWRPGKPHPEAWAGNYRQALAAVRGQE